MPSSHHLGAHFSVAGGLENAIYTAKDLDCTAVQIFTKNARAWADPSLSDMQVRQFRRARRDAGIHFAAAHCTYLINIATPDPVKREKAVASLRAEMDRSAALGLDAVVLHPGAHLGQGVEKGLDTAARSLNAVLMAPDMPRLLLETTAGSGTTLGSRFEELAWLLDALDPQARAGVCMDTSHIFAAGYDLRSPAALDHTLDEFHRHIGLSRLFLIHVNDSIPDLGSFKDRHAHVGEGAIGPDGFAALMQSRRIAAIPKILETPKEKDGMPMDPVNLNRLRQFASA